MKDFSRQNTTLLFKLVKNLLLFLEWRYI